jgi:hypothetical protein
MKCLFEQVLHPEATCARRRFAFRPWILPRRICERAAIVGVVGESSRANRLIARKTAA